MASKKIHKEPESSARNAYIIMIAGALAVLGLVGWALNRSFNAPVSDVPLSTQSPIAQPVQTTAPLSTDPHQQDPERAAVPRIEPQALRPKQLNGEVTIIDVRDADSYTTGHIPGAIHIPFARIEGEIPYLPRAKPIVTYCT